MIKACLFIHLLQIFSIMENLNFVALDLETANSERSSICEIGITIVRDSQIIESKSWLVKPKDNYYDGFNILIHGITPRMTKNCPYFKEVWKEVEPYLNNQIVVAHNTAFDMYALRDSFINNKITFPTFKHFCSCRIAKYTFSDTYTYSLSPLCDAMSIEFESHHRAESDSIACAKVFIKSLELANVSSLEELESKYGFKCGEFAPDYFKPQLSCKPAKTKTKEIQGDSEKIDEGSYFYQKTVCFTGKLNYSCRNNLQQKIADIGGYPVDSVTFKTDVLVVGQQDYRIVGEDGISSKQKKAIELKDKGHDIEIMSESDFLRFI